MLLVSSIRREAFLIGTFFFISVLPFLGIAGIWGSTEAREVHVASIIYETNEWILPLRNGVIPSKPPLHHWIAAFLGEIRGGVTPAVVRCVSLLAASGILIITFIFVAVKSSSRMAAIFSVSVLGTFYPTLHLSQDARVDMTFAFFVTCAIFVVLRDLPDLPSPKSIFIFWLACGFAVLAKGPLGIALPLVCIACSMVVNHGINRSIRRLLIPSFGWLVCGSLVCAWYVPAIYYGSDTFVGKQLIFENLQRFFGGENFRKEEWWFYFTVFFGDVLPWPVLFFFFGVKYLKKKNDSLVSVKTSRSDEQISIALLVVIISMFIFFTLAWGKRASYLLPIYPLMAAFLGIELTKRIKRLSDSKVGVLNEYLGRISGVSVLLLLSGVAILEVIKNLSVESFPVVMIVADNLQNEILLIQFTLIIWALAVMFLKGKHRVAVSLVALSAFLSAGIAFGLAVKGELKGFEKAASNINKLVSKEETLVVVKNFSDEYFDPVMYYLNRPVTISPNILCLGKNLARKEKVMELSKNPRLTIRVINEIQTGYKQPGDPIKTLVLFRCHRSQG